MRHLYVHVPFCAHRCGYCDFVTVTGHDDQHAPYVDALLAELPPRRTWIRPASRPCSSAAARRRCSAGAARPPAGRPAGRGRAHGRVQPGDGHARAGRGAGRRAACASRSARSRSRRRCSPCSSGAPRPRWSRRPSRRCARPASRTSRSTCIHGIPGQDRALLDADLDRLLALAPDHCSVYELEAKPGTRFTHAHGAELARQARAARGALRARHRAAGGGRLHVVRDARTSAAPGPRVAAQPRLLAGPRLPRHRRRRRLDGGRPSGA